MGTIGRLRPDYGSFFAPAPGVFFINKYRYSQIHILKNKTMSDLIHPVLPADYDELVSVWEASVRATHHFLKEEDLIFYRKAIHSEYLSSGMLQLFCLKDESGIITGFTGLSEDHIEMLFVSPDNMGQGIGKTLLRFGVDDLNKHKVDVNEQNDQAIGFYAHFGFRVAGRSAVDSSGKPYPILHMSL